MDAEEELRIDVRTEKDGESRSLADWLLTDQGRFHVFAQRTPGPNPWIDEDTESLVVILHAGTGLEALAASLAAWMGSRRSNTTIRVSANGITVELRSGLDTADLRRLLQQTLVPSIQLPSFDYRIGPVLSLEAGDRIRPVIHLASAGDQVDSETSTMPVTIYLSAEEIHDEVEGAVEVLLATAGLRIESRDDPILGSWFRRMLVAAKEVIRSPAGREASLVVAHAADTRLVLAQDAAVTATLMQNLAPVIASLQNTKDAVIRVGALLIVKRDWAEVNVFQLTAAQQLLLDHHPQLATSPHTIVAALELSPESDQGKTPPALH